MAWCSLDEAINHPKFPREWEETVVSGQEAVPRFISDLIAGLKKPRKAASIVALDGYLGVEWEKIVPRIAGRLRDRGLAVEAIAIASCHKRPVEIEGLVAPCLTSDPHFGTVFPGKLADFFDSSRLRDLQHRVRGWKRGRAQAKPSPDVVLIYGAGAALPALGNLYHEIFYFDLSRETLVSQVERNEVLPLGAHRGGLSCRIPFKRLSYVDYRVLNDHKKKLLTRMNWYVDANDSSRLKLLPRGGYDAALSLLSEYPFRLKPVYMPGVWGGQEMKKIRSLPDAMVNCAFSLELIPQEQSIRIAVGEAVLDIPFYNLVWHQPAKIMGAGVARRFRGYFPITLNYDDTMNGGDLAIQVHPHGRYLQRNFAERIRRDEAYYVVKTQDGARTYHGLRTETDLGELRQLCVRAEREKLPFDQDRYINSWPSRVGDLFLIPAGTIHASGRNQLVLEIDTDPSATGQEYTFHLYDYLRPDLNGDLRAIHVDHSFHVIRPYRRQAWVARNLRPSPRLLRKGRGWAEYLLGRRPDMYHEVRCLEFERRIADDTKGRFHVLTLVKGKSALVRSRKHPERQYQINFTETVVVPACLGEYVVENLGEVPAKLTKALLKSHE